MNIEDRQFLTEWGGETWHDFQKVSGEMMDAEYQCKKCRAWRVPTDEAIAMVRPAWFRTFDNWNDFGWLWDLVVKYGMVEAFFLWLMIKTQQNDYLCDYEWLWAIETPCSRCRLICDFLRERGGK